MTKEWFYKSQDKIGLQTYRQTRQDRWDRWEDNLTAGHCDKFWTIERPVGEGNQKDEKLGKGGYQKDIYTDVEGLCN